MNVGIQDIRLALRAPRKRPGYTAVAAVACLIPARKAARTDPMEVLRFE